MPTAVLSSMGLTSAQISTIQADQQAVETALQSAMTSSTHGDELEFEFEFDDSVDSSVGLAVPGGPAGPVDDGLRRPEWRWDSGGRDRVAVSALIRAVR